jgi:ankyrin repeat protein
MHWRVVLAGYSALMMAASLGFKDLVQKLLEKRADVNAEEKKGNK